MPWANQTGGRGGNQPPRLGAVRAPTSPAVQAGVPLPRAVWLPNIETDATTRTVTSSFAQLSGAFNVAAGDAAIGGVYKIRVWGTYTAATIPTIRIRPVIFGTTLAALAASPTAGTGISYWAEAWVFVTATGSSGSINGMVAYSGGEFTFEATIPATAVNTLVASTFELQASISTGSLSGVGSIYERDGPGAFQ